MSTNQLFILFAILTFLAFGASRAGWAPALVGSYVITLGGLTTVLYVMEGKAGHSGIGTNAPMLLLSDVLIVLSVLTIWSKGGRLGIGGLLAVFSVPALFLLVHVWGDEPEQWAGLKLYVTALVSFGVGRWLSENLTDAAAFVLACACLSVCAVQFFVAFGQWIGISLVFKTYTSESKGIIEDQGRMTGLYEHPAFLGKTVFLLLCLLLPLVLRSQGMTRKFAYLSLALGVFAAALTLSRANTVAILLALLLWPVLRGRANSAFKSSAAVVFAVGLLAASTNLVSNLLERQQLNAEGGPRGWLFSVGLGQIRAEPLIGTGPNYYNEIVGQYDALAAAGLPIHNSFLLAVAELGIPLALIFFSPLFLALGSALLRMVRQKRIDDLAATLFAIVPGLLLIGWTGWGLLHMATLPLWFLAFGFLSPRNSAEADQRPARTASPANLPLRA